jgi:hypothetical protein
VAERMIRLIMVGLVLAVLSLPVPALAQEQDNGVITGQVINDTIGSVVSGVEVTLIIYIDNVLADSITTVTGNDGSFIFDNINLEHTYLISAKYREVDYYYQVIFEPGETTAYVSVGVCDITTDDGAIRIGKAHIVIELEEESFHITEIIWLFNDGDRTLTGTDSVLLFTLPDGADDFEAPQELMIDYVLLDNNRLTYLVPFPPGGRQLIYSYSLARPDLDEAVIPFTVDYPADSLEIMAAGEDIEVTVSRLAPADPVFAETGERFIHFVGSDITRGGIIEVTISGLSTGLSIPLLVLIIVAAVVAGGAIGFFSIRKVGKKVNES